MASKRPHRAADPGALLATTHDVGGGARVRLRLARPSDAPRVRAFLRGSDALARHYTFYDPRERVVVAATAPLGRTEQIVGLADLALLHDGVSELGVVVRDDLQGRGVGAVLTDAVAALASQHGVTQLKAELSSLAA